METYVETFFNLDDAVRWVEYHVDEHPKDEYELLELRINYLGGAFRAGVSFKKLNHQLELPGVLNG